MCIRIVGANPILTIYLFIIVFRAVTTMVVMAARTLGFLQLILPMSIFTLSTGVRAFTMHILKTELSLFKVRHLSQLLLPVSKRTFPLFTAFTVQKSRA